MRKFILLTLLNSVALFSQYASAGVMVDWIVNVDGAISENYNGDPLPLTGELTDGFGTLSMKVTGEGFHSVIGFFDFEIDQQVNTFFNESGSATGTAAAGQSWEIDEPGYLFGDIVDNVYSGSLDNSNGVPVGAEDDMSFAMGWDFSLQADDMAIIDFIFTDILPSVDFFISHFDADSNSEFYFYSALSIQNSGAPVVPPVTSVDEPSTLVIMFIGLLFVVSRKIKYKA